MNKITINYYQEIKPKSLIVMKADYYGSVGPIEPNKLMHVPAGQIQEVDGVPFVDEGYLYLEDDRVFLVHQWK